MFFLLALGGAALEAREASQMFQGADLKLCERFISESKCVARHQEKVGGDGSAIYKPVGHINGLTMLQGMWSNAIRGSIWDFFQTK